MPGTPPLAGESQGGTTVTSAIRTPERLRGTPELIPALAPEAQGTSEAQVEPLASTALQGSNGVPGRDAACLISRTWIASTSSD